MKIYTKTGDTGLTSLIGGTRVPKHHLRIEAYGTVDELNSWIGLIRDQELDQESIRTLLEVQDRLFTIGSHLASDPDKGRMKLPEIHQGDVEILEKEIDRMSALLPELKSFILPGGNTIVSYTHIARCVCRRCERLTTHLNEEAPVNEKIIIYLNRLSDYLFVLGRFIGMNQKAIESPWNPKL